MVFGIDAGVPEFLKRWSNEGYLPNVASIIRNGNCGEISDHEMISAHGLWLSLFSGMSRSDHGYYYFRQLVPGTYDVRPVNLANSKAYPFWQSLQSKILIIDAPEVYPIKGLTGYQLSNWAIHNAMDSPFSNPAEFLKAAGPQIKAGEKFSASEEDDNRIYQLLIKRIQKKGAFACQFLQQEQFDLIVIVFSESHIAGHQFWKYRNNSGSSPNPLRNIYQEIDLQFNHMLQQLPQNANIFIVSPMGISDQNPTGGLTQAFCLKLGYQIKHKNHVPSFKPGAFAQKVIPETLRSAAGSVLPPKLRQRFLSDLFGRNTNWGKTRAFALPSNYTGLLRVNLEGREPQGIVKQGNEYTQLLNELETNLKQLIDPVSNLSAVEKVIRTADIFHTGPPNDLPDIFIKWRPTSYFLERVQHPETELTQQKPKLYRTNNHTETGFFACAGPGIVQKFERQNISLLDIAPGLLELTQDDC